ncbi:MAG: transporter substrate-binding domain-containing protein, partial [Deltaproteobacteria bacterium]|nr:transporter substrate-binding domain-containing protein [Deltaproteobacteria bacterium]
FVIGLSLLIFATPVFAGDKVYKIQCDNTAPYIFWTDESKTKVTGLWAETVRAVMTSMGETHEEFKIYPWSRLLDMGLKGEVDGVFGAAINEERLHYMWFPKEPLLADPWVFWIRKSDIGKLKFTAYADLKNHRIGLVRGYNYTKELWDFVKKEQNYEEVVHDSMNFRKLIKGRVDYIASALHFGAHVAIEEGILEQVQPLTEKPIVNSVFYVMFNKKNVSPEWVNKFSEHLAAFKKTAEYRALMNKFGVMAD